MRLLQHKFMSVPLQLPIPDTYNYHLSITLLSCLGFSFQALGVVMSWTPGKGLVVAWQELQTAIPVTPPILLQEEEPHCAMVTGVGELQKSSKGRLGSSGGS